MPLRKTRAGRTNIFSILLLAAVGVVLVGAWTFGPYYLDFMYVKEASASAALKWYAEEDERGGRNRLVQKLEENGIDYLDPKQCEFSRSRDMTIRVYCHYEVYAYYPFSDYYKILPFEVDNYVDSRGNLEQYD